LLLWFTIGAGRVAPSCGRLATRRDSDHPFLVQFFAAAAYPAGRSTSRTTRATCRDVSVPRRFLDQHRCVRGAWMMRSAPSPRHSRRTDPGCTAGRGNAVTGLGTALLHCGDRPAFTAAAISYGPR
jgi:hypothetical protein